jgi:hypothetical protein
VIYCADQKKSGRLTPLGLEWDYGSSCLTDEPLWKLGIELDLRDRSSKWSA